MGSSCREIAESLVDCMAKTQCMKNGGEMRQCMRKISDEGTGECSDMRNAYFTCKRSSLDMRSRIRGPRVT